MGGIFGSHPLDRYRENELFDYLNSFDDDNEITCSECTKSGDLTDFEVEEYVNEEGEYINMECDCGNAWDFNV